MKVLVYIVMSSFVILAAYGLWLVGKKINYALAYEDGVETTIKEMVKPECLKDTQP